MDAISFSDQSPSIEIGPISTSSFPNFLKGYEQGKIAILVDENTHYHCLEFLITTFDTLREAEIIEIPSGEQSKDLAICTQLWHSLTESNFGRHDLLINLGGGVVSDLGGFVASVYKRGIPFINVPTSLLGMLDAAIGSKNGIDFLGFKNQLGSFTPALRTFVDVNWLHTLPQKEWLNGYAELLKHSLIYDAILWEELLLIDTIEKELTAAQIKRGIDIKNEIVAQDPLEKGLRKILNFGHTIGHAIEAYYLETDKPLSHGHAVAIGMLLEAHLSLQLSGLQLSDFQQIKEVVLNKFSLHLPSDKSLIWQLMQHDKKNREGQIRMSLLAAVGECKFDQHVKFVEFEQAYDSIAALK